MSIATHISCDNCGKVKEKTNHWYMINIGHGSIVIRPLDTNDMNEFDWIICCGEGCALNHLSTIFASLHL